MPLSNEELRRELESHEVENVATMRQPGTHSGGSVASVDLVFDGLAYDPKRVLKALEAEFGEAQVVSDRDHLSPGQLQFRILGD